MIKDIWESLERTISDRFKSPFAGAFIISWLTINWQVPYYIFTIESAVNYSSRSDMLDKLYANYWHTLIFPFLSAVIYVAVFPYVNNLLFRLYLHQKKKRDQIRNIFPITPEEQSRLMSSMVEQKKNFDESIRSLVTERDLLLSRVSNADAEVTRLRSGLEERSNVDRLLQKPENGQNKAEQEYLSIIQNPNIAGYLDMLVTAIQAGATLDSVPMKTRTYLTNKGIIKRKPNAHAQFYELTPKGNGLVAFYMDNYPENRIGG